MAFQTWIDGRNSWVVNASASMLTASGVTGTTFQPSNYPENDVFSPSAAFRGSVGFGIHGNSVVT